MKKLTYLVALMFATILLNTSCEKSNNTEDTKDARVRISKMASNDNFETPTLFKYNDKNQLVKILEESQYTSQIQYITYNAENKPIQITDKDSSNVSNYCYTEVTSIEWKTDGFITTSSLQYKFPIIYKLDSKGRIIEETSDGTTTSSPYHYAMNWIGEDSLYSQFTSSVSSSASSNHSYKYVKCNNVFTGINIAILELCGLDIWNTDKYSIAKWTNEGYTAQATYTLNDKNYPIIEDIKYSSSEGITHDFIYYEYESY